ncbi:hypothetical protein EV421DRAFT_1992537 [Armillaria borealis]|uniref:Uncharacterized protein n=1 Tax=Armillaria borealis TaxID=47425 RepID=A0AA39MHX4_9AGAR|nr:hypothetical protein EV421DRAFT_1992537 [Armillaria borealis]
MSAFLAAVIGWGVATGPLFVLRIVDFVDCSSIFTPKGQMRATPRIHFQSGDEPYLPGTTVHLQFQAQGSNAFEPLAFTLVKLFEPFTPAAVLPVQRLSDNDQAILKLTDHRLWYRSGKGRPAPWSSSLEDRLRRAVHDIQAGVSPDWFELICVVENRREEHRQQKDWLDRE